MKVLKNHTADVIAKIFKDRLKEIGLSQTRLIKQYGDRELSTGTLWNILKGRSCARIDTIASLCDILGLEIIIRPKQNNDENDENKD